MDQSAKQSQSEPENGPRPAIADAQPSAETAFWGKQADPFASMPPLPEPRLNVRKPATPQPDRTRGNAPPNGGSGSFLNESASSPGGDVFSNFIAPYSHGRFSAIGNPDVVWERFKDLPGVRNWRVLNDSLFLVLSFVMGLIWFIVGTVMFSIGAGLLIIWVGIPILAATFALMIWGAQLERSRIKVFLGVEIPTPYSYLPKTGAPWKRAWGFVRNPQL